MRALLHGLIDYAGLFPPAKLDMAHAVQAFAKERAGRHADALARFICPVSRLGEFAKAAAPLLPNPDAVPARAAGRSGKGVPRLQNKARAGGGGGSGVATVAGAPLSHHEPWAVSALIDGPLAANIAAIEEFNAAHHKNHHSSAVVDTVELKVTSVDAVDAALEVLPAELTWFFEVPTTGDVRAFAAALAGTGACAKIRTGGVTADAFPTREQVADFLLIMADSKIAFKATAGLHHPVRAAFPLTYERNAPTGTMHGFLNVFLAAALVFDQSIDRETVVHLLGETVAERFKFDSEGASWRGLKLSTGALARAREGFALCFGSCSFEEPLADLARLGLLD
jgi:hypothetical protein